MGYLTLKLQKQLLWLKKSHCQRKVLYLLSYKTFNATLILMDMEKKNKQMVYKSHTSFLYSQ